MSATSLQPWQALAASGHSGSHPLFSAVLEAFPVACFVVDNEHRVTHWNRACQILTGVASAEIVGTSNQGQVFYGSQRMVMADLILCDAADKQVDELYHGKFRPSQAIPGTYEAEDFFPHFGDGGRWLFFTASPLYDEEGNLIGAIETLQDITERRRAEEALKASEKRFKTLSRTDPLTLMFNFRHFYEVLEKEIERAERYKHPLSLIVIDVDHFKQVNDRYGHLEGDRVLKRLAEEIANWKRRTDIGFRYGGDEFAVLLPETDKAQAEEAAIRLAKHWSQLPEPATLGCTLSIGVGQHAPDEPLQAFIRRTDAAAYQAKRLGRNRVASDGNPLSAVV